MPGPIPGADTRWRRKQLTWCSGSLQICYTIVLVGDVDRGVALWRIFDSALDLPGVGGDNPPTLPRYVRSLRDGSVLGYR